jgi:hypothetical protein
MAAPDEPGRLVIPVLSSTLVPGFTGWVCPPCRGKQKALKEILQGFLFALLTLAENQQAILEE